MYLTAWFHYDKDYKQYKIKQFTNLKHILSPTQQKIFDIYLAELQLKEEPLYSYYNNSSDKKIEMKHPLWQHWQNVFPMIIKEPLSTYLSFDEKMVIETLLGKEKAKVFFQALDNLLDYPYQIGWYRRTLRSHKLNLYLHRIFEVLDDFIIYSQTKLTPIDKLKLSRQKKKDTDFAKEDYIYIQSSSIYTLTAEIDANNTLLIKFIEDIILGDNQTAFLSYNLINAIVKSHNLYLHKLLGDLLLAGRLQEGLRQAITENMDNGSKEAFLYLLNIIKENNMLRYSSIKRAIATWTSLIDMDNSDKISKQELNLFTYFLTNENKRHEALTSQNPIEVYIALWSYAFYDVDTTIPFVLDLFNHGKKHQQLVAAYFLNASNDQELIFKLRYELITKAQLTEQDCQLIATLFHCNFSQLETISYIKQNFTTEQLTKYYYSLKILVQKLPKEKIYSPCIFPWHIEKLSLSTIVKEMADIAKYLNSPELLDDFCIEYPKLDSFERYSYLKRLYNSPQTAIQREFLFQLLKDKSVDVRQECYKIINKLILTNEEYEFLMSLLKYKYSDLRQNIIKLLLKQTNTQLLASIQMLLSNKQQLLRLAGLDILLQIQKNSRLKALFEQGKMYTELLAKPTANEQILIAQIHEDFTNNPTTNNLDYNTTLVTKLSLDTIHNELSFAKIYVLSVEEIHQKIIDLTNFYESHKMFAYQPAYGDEQLLDNGFAVVTWDEKISLYKYPYPQLWQEFYQKYIKTPEILYQMYLYICLHHKLEKLYFAQTINSVFNDNDSGNDKYRLYAKEHIEKLQNLERLPILVTIIKNLYEYYVPKTYCFAVAKFWALRHLATFNLAQSVKKDKKTHLSNNFLDSYSYHQDLVGRTFILNPLLANYENDDEFRDSFSLLYNLYTQYKYEIYLPIYNFLRANYLNMIAIDELYIDIFQRNNGYLESKLQQLSSLYEEKFTTLALMDFSVAKQNMHQDLWKFAQNFADIVIEQILSIELTRGDLPTKYTKVINSLKCIRGTKYFVDILLSLGKSKLKNTTYLWSEVTNRESIFSYLLSICEPRVDETAKDLKKYLKDKDISANRLVEACMLNPIWIPIVDKILKWKGFISGCYYFLAHMREADKKLAVTFAKYTPISIENLRDGAFDLDWFKSCYKQLGAKHFALLYDAAKYIAEGNVHTRARKYADAVNGVLNADEVKSTIIQKRNKELLMAYGLIPLSKSGKITKSAQKEMLNRYKFIQQFLKESKQFGVQRRASEGLACKIALENLARNARFDDSFRFTLNMETRLIHNQQTLFLPKTVGDYVLYLIVDKLGKSSIICEKQGKKLKSLPTKLKKEPYYLILKEAKIEFTDQYRRSRIMFEQAMENSTVFLASELTMLQQNPVLKPLLENIVFIHEKNIGYFANNSLIDIFGEKFPLEDTAKVRIAHVVDLYQSGVWQDYQQDLFTRQIKQPFKQVFRELYLKIDDEINLTKSRRYEGHQIQPQKAYATLKNRNWLADYDEGLEKIYYQENIIANIYAVADWFTPADIEAPTLEYVAFYDRKTFKPMLIKDIPDIIFSETMRDVDLAVSIAHVGGVDPETSHSTIQMRQAILEFTLPLFKLTNVSFNGNFAIVKGQLANYSIHLGSGNVHQINGAQIALSVVPSQHRGRLFLPFVDDDPKTAEIITKVLFFAEDKTIKDPFILNQIR